MFKLMALLTLVCSLNLFAQPIPRPIPPIDLPQSVLCRQECVNGNLQMTFTTIGSISNNRNCPGNPSTTLSCAPYNCQQGTTRHCATSCGSNQDCAAGFFCNTSAQKCMPLSYYCADQYTVAGTDGSSANCVPYVCQAGRCKEACGTSNDCQGGFLCDVQHRVCIRP